MTNQHIFITGGASGIGAAAVHTLKAAVPRRGRKT